MAGLLLIALTTPRLAAAQDNPPDSTEVVRHFSLYLEHFKNGNYTDALPDLRWSLKNAPASPYNDDRNFKRGVILYDSLAARADDPATRRAHLDAALALHDDAVATLPGLGAEIDVFKWTLGKGRFIQTHPDDFADRMDEAIDAYRAAYDLDLLRLDPYYIDLIVRDDLSREDYSAALARLDDILRKRGDDPGIQGLVETQVQRVPLDEQAAFWQQRLADDPTNHAIKERLLGILLDLEWREEAIALAEELLKTEPTPDLLILLADFYLHDGDYARALELYALLLEMPDYDPTAEVYYNMGFAEHQLDNLPPARAHYRKAIALDPAFGLAYLAIGDLYATAVSVCSGNSIGRDDQAVYWLVIDWYEKAKQAAPSNAMVVNEANAKISAYRRYFPNNEDRFYRGWEIGQSFSINYGCYSWIGETTTVKSL